MIADAVRQALTAQAVIAHYGLELRRAGTELEGPVCPARADHSRRRAFVINAETGLWQCFPCGTSGDLFDLIMGLERTPHFLDALKKGAEIAGVDGEADSAAVRRYAEARARAKVAQAEADKNRRARALEIAGDEWDELYAGHKAGEAYLERRGILDVPLVIRFYGCGDPAIPQWTADGRMVNVVRRRIAGGEPKILGLTGCPTLGTFGHSLDQVDGGTVVMVEGWADSLTALLMWPGARVLGANGAGNMRKLAAPVVKRCLERGARLVIVPHEDHAGEQAACDVRDVAVAAGMNELSLRVVDLGGHKDLNDAWRAGWRP